MITTDTVTTDRPHAISTDRGWALRGSLDAMGKHYHELQARTYVGVEARCGARFGFGCGTEDKHGDGSGYGAGGGREDGSGDGGGYRHIDESDAPQWRDLLTETAMANLEWRLVIHVANRRIVWGRVDTTEYGETLTVHDARCVIYYPTGGDLALALGPVAGMYVGPRIPAVTMDRRGAELVMPTPGGVALWAVIPDGQVAVTDRMLRSEQEA